MKVENMKSARTGKAIPNQFIITDGNTMYFQSYKTMICRIYKATNDVTIDNGESFDGKEEFSRTTLKYLLSFIREYTMWNVKSKANIDSLIKDGLFHTEDLNA